MLYLLDANVLIRAHEDHYPLDRIPQFWVWLLEKGQQGTVRIPSEIVQGELLVYEGPLKQWMGVAENRTKLTHADATDPVRLNNVIDNGYAPDLTDDELEKIGRDPFLIAYATANPAEITVVSREVSAPSKQRANRRVPDVCGVAGVRCINDFQFLRELAFSIPTV